MPPRKRKAEAPAEDGDDGILPTPSKKSKKEMAAEARAKAKAWRDARHSKTPTPSTASSKKSSATTSSPTFSAGKSPHSKKISTSTTSSATKRRRTTSTRKSTGGLVNSRTSSPTTSGNEAPARKSRRSIAASTKFEFKEPLRKKEGEEESSSDDVEMTKKHAAVQSGGNKKSSKKSTVKYEFGKDYLTMNDSEEEEDEEEKEIVEKKKSSTSASSAAKAKTTKSQGRAAIQALREQREKKGLRVSGHHHPLSPSSGGMKSPPETNYPDPPTTAAAAASAAAGSSARLKSPDPPASSTTKPPSAATSSTSTKKPKSSSSTKKKPPAAVASLFNTSKNKQIKSTAHRPYKQTFDPSKPFPSTGYKLPTAAYCGCGPSLGSATTSVRGQTQFGSNGLGGGGDVCMVNTTNNNGPDDVVGRGSFNAKDTFSLQQPVDPPYKSRYGQEQAAEGDEMKKMAAAKPSPPGKNGGTHGANSAATEPTSAATTAPPREEPVQNAGILQAILRAKALVSSAASGNQKRRTAMGIKGTIVPHNIPQTAVNPPTGQQPIDPPPSNAIDSAPISYAATLQKFRDTGANSNEATKSTEIKSAAAAAVKTEDNGKSETTDAGENTSEAGGENEESNGIINKEEDESEVVAEEQNKRPGIIKSSCLVIGKFIMVVQLSFGLFYVASLAASNINWDEFKNIIPENMGSAAEQEEEVSPSCFIDSRYWDGGVIPKGWKIHDGREDHHEEEEEEGKPIDDLCAGRYKQCPLYGRCYRGLLQDCLDEDGLFDGIKRHVPNEKKDGCIVSSQATELAEIVQQVLEDMTVAQTCGTSDKTWGDENMSKEEPFPLFYPEMVAKRMNVYDSYTHLILDTDEGRRIDVTVDFLVWLSPAFDHTKIEFGPTTWLTMGLSQGVPPNSLHLPLDCTMKLLFWELLEGFFEWTALFMLFSFENGWWLVSTYPLYCLGAAVFLQGCIALQKRRKHKAKVRELYDTIYEAVYDRLAECEDHEGFAALHLRDQISRDIYPTNKREQQFVIDHVWPRMVREIWSDNRVRKFRRVAMGKELEHWDFAVQAKRIRRERRSLGTPGRGNTLNALVNVKKEEDETPAKRDP